jgi:hypothetical protein
LIQDYNTFQYGNQYYGKNGIRITQITGPAGNPINLNADVSGYNNTMMIQWASKGKVLGATYFGAASIPIETVNSNLAYSHIIGITFNPSDSF